MSNKAVVLEGENGTYSFFQNQNNVLGKGGTGIVYKGKKISESQEQDTTYVAVKMLYIDSSGDPKIIARIKRASEIVIDHPGLLKILDFIEFQDQFYVISEILYGNTLDILIEDNVKNNRYYKKETVVSFTCSIIESVSALHNHDPQIIHRDIKPGNIMVCDNGSIKLLDYGIAKIGGRLSESADITKTGKMIGTPAYLPPEQIRGLVDQISPATDLYSIGIMLYQLFTNELPFNGSPFDIISAHEKNIIPYHNKIPTGFYNIILKATDKNPLNRYHQADKFIGDLRNALSLKDRSKIRKKIRIPSWDFLLKGLLIAVLIVSVFHLINHHSRSPESTDSDHDGIIDSMDACPEHPGLKVNNGCPKPKPPDHDNDGIVDSIDACPMEPGLQVYDGCPEGSDFDCDGITDSIDICPKIPGKKIYNGCPEPADTLLPTEIDTIDTDGDGIVNSKDYCPNVFGLLSKYGCPGSDEIIETSKTNTSDLDKDGIFDHIDECPEIPGQVLYYGCPDTNDASNFCTYLNEARRLKDQLDCSKTIVYYRSALNLKKDSTAKAEMLEFASFCDDTYDTNLTLSQSVFDETQDSDSANLYLKTARRYALTDRQLSVIDSISIIFNNKRIVVDEKTAIETLIDE